MHPFFKYTLILISTCAISRLSFGDEGHTVTLYDLENEKTTLAALEKNEALFIAQLDDIEKPDEVLRFITLVESSRISDRTHSIICIPLETTSYLNRKTKSALIKNYIKGDYMRSKLYLAEANQLKSLLQSNTFGLIGDSKPLWLSNTCPKNEKTLINDIAHHTQFSE